MNEPRALETLGHRAPGLARNVVANFAGRGWAAVVNLLFVPFYVRILGIDAYGLVGLYVTLLALLAALDMGLSATITRQLARLSVATTQHPEARTLLRTMELIYWGMGLVIGAAWIAASGVASRHWAHSETISPDTIRRAFMIMGCVAACEWPTSLYAGALVGLQRQVVLNAIRASLATLQAIGAVLVLYVISPTVLAYFIWQAAIVLVQTLVLAKISWIALGGDGDRPSFDLKLLLKSSAFASGIAVFSILGSVLSHLDKLLLSKLVTLQALGYYTLAFNAAGAVLMLAQPVFVAVYPRLSQLALASDERGVSRLYHRSCRLVAVLVIPLAMTIAFFPELVLRLWIRDAFTAERASGLLRILVMGSALNALVTMPLALQLAHGWTRLAVVKNVIAAVVCVPLLYGMIVWRGTVGAAAVWTALNAAYFLLEVPYMHRRLLRRDMKRWYLVDTLAPIGVAAAIAGASRYFLPPGMAGLGALTWISSTWVLAVVAVASMHRFTSPAQIRGYAKALIEGH